MSYKCAHPGCTCLVAEKWSYCSPTCASGTSNATCSCGHPGCKGGSVAGQDHGSRFAKLIAVLVSAGLFLLAWPARIDSRVAT